MKRNILRIIFILAGFLAAGSGTVRLTHNKWEDGVPSWGILP